MKKFLFSAFLTLTTVCSFGQKFSLNDLTFLCSKKNWEDVNQFLLNKGWSYYDSKAGNSTQYNIITWSFEKEYYSDKAQGWFYLYTYEGIPNKIQFSFFNKDSYNSIQKGIEGLGFKLKKSGILDNKVTSEYTNNGFNLTVEISKRVDENNSERSLAAYDILLIRKEGVYDNENGVKKEYDELGNLSAEYTLKNGELNGVVLQYYPNGRLRSRSNYINGKAQGLFEEFNSEGKKTSEYSMSNDVKNGILKYFENGRPEYTATYRNDSLNGQFTRYYYSNDTVVLSESGKYINNDKDGTWTSLLLTKPARIFSITNYRKGVKHGPFIEPKGDSLIVGRYKEDLKDGQYRIYLDISRMLFGSFLNTDTSDLVLICKGAYVDDMKTGHWNFYDYTGAIRSSGEYYRNMQTGEWKYYFSKTLDDNSNPLPWSQKLYLVQNYSNDKLNGRSERYGYLEEKKYPCPEKYDAISSDTCSKLIFHKITEKSFYKNGLLNGSYELRDSVDNIMRKGFFEDDLKKGEWMERFSQENGNEGNYYTYQKGSYLKGKRNGKWIEYNDENFILETLNYSDGKPDGERIIWKGKDRYSEIIKYDNGKFRALTVYDSLGITPGHSYDILEDDVNHILCRSTTYSEAGSESQVYWLKNQGEIDPLWFDLFFLINTGKLSDGTTGYKEGEFKLYDNNNRILISGSYARNQKIYEWTHFYYDQNVKIILSYINGIPGNERYFSLDNQPFSGEFIFIDKENNIKEIRSIKKGFRNGKTTYIDNSTQKVLKKESYSNGKLK
jgi:antitoxin component YwqK of YwqJK toxin-antitoxin module